MPFKYHDRKFKKCKYCDKEARRNEKNGRNKGHYRTCGEAECLKRQYKDENVCVSKRFYGERKCESCGYIYVAISPKQRWCKDCVPDMSARQRMIRYALSQKSYLLMIEEVNGICPICKKREASVVDHCHKTNKIRGIICGHCNTALNLVEDIEALKRAINYIKL